MRKIVTWRITTYHIIYILLSCCELPRLFSQFPIVRNPVSYAQQCWVATEIFLNNLLNTYKKLPNCQNLFNGNAKNFGLWLKWQLPQKSLLRAIYQFELIIFRKYTLWFSIYLHSLIFWGINSSKEFKFKINMCRQDWSCDAMLMVKNLSSYSTVLSIFNCLENILRTDLCIFVPK